MASGEATSAELMRQARRGNQGDGPVLTLKRTVIQQNGSLYGNLTDEGRRIAGFAGGEPIDVHVFPEGVVILPNGRDTDD